MPVLVIHGNADPMIDMSGGRATAEAIPGSRLWVIPGLAHDLPPALFGEIADAVAVLAEQAGYPGSRSRSRPAVA